MPNTNLDNPEGANITSVNGKTSPKKIQGGAGGLVNHIMHIVRENRQVRDRLYKDAWGKYERTFRGLYSGSDRTRDGERSRLVAPALAAAVESTAATIEDAIFSREKWFDSEDNLSDQQPADIQAAHLQLEEDFDTANVPDAIAKVVLNGCLYGTGIGKVNITRKEIRNFSEDGKVQKEMRPIVTLESIPPWEFVIDSQARDIESAYFVAHETHVPRNKVWSRIKDGTYRSVNLLGNTSTAGNSPTGEQTPDGMRKTETFDGSVFVTEYYGLVPASLLKGLVKEIPAGAIQGNGHVEIIATVANELELLRVILNPFSLKDRPIVAYQHSVVPGKFWGRGVAEKGWNAQRALDAELRARMDALGLLTSPMMGADITRLPRNPDMGVRPGKVWLTRGRPSEVLEPVILGNIDPNTFNQSSEMERMVSTGTGALESNAPINENRRNETASGISMMQSSGLKRMRRTMWNIERQFLNPFIKKAMIRYMQFSPSRYKKDYEFRVRGTMGIVAKEFEQSNLTALLSVVPPDTPSYNVILRSVIELSNSPKRDEIIAQLEEMEKPNPQQQQLEQEMQMLQVEAQREAVKEQKLENIKTQAEIKKIQAEIQEIQMEIQFKDEEVSISAANAATGAEKVRLGFKQDKTNMEKIKSEERKAKIQASAVSKANKSKGK